MRRVQVVVGPVVEVDDRATDEEIAAIGWKAAVEHGAVLLMDPTNGDVFATNVPVDTTPMV